MNLYLSKSWQTIIRYAWIPQHTAVLLFWRQKRNKMHGKVAANTAIVLTHVYKWFLVLLQPFSESSCSAAGTVELHSIWSNTVYRSPMWRHGSTSVQPVDVFWSYRVTVSARTAAGRLPSLARRPGTLSGIISGIRTVLQTTSITCWKRFCSQRTSAIRALDVSRRCAL